MMYISDMISRTGNMMPTSAPPQSNHRDVDRLEFARVNNLAMVIKLLMPVFEMK
jgi:hypothetical protein